MGLGKFECLSGKALVCLFLSVWSVVIVLFTPLESEYFNFSVILLRWSDKQLSVVKDIV